VIKTVKIVCNFLNIANLSAASRDRRSLLGKSLLDITSTDTVWLHAGFEPLLGLLCLLVETFELDICG